MRDESEKVARAIVLMCAGRVYQRDGLVDKVAEVLRSHAASQLAELEAARAVVEWARGMVDDPHEQPGPLVRSYDAAKAGKAVE